ncbi:MAG: DUF817 family protein, partial [Minisyncoccales bacterium]
KLRRLYIKMKKYLYEFWIFGLKQLQACIFAGSFFFLLSIASFMADFFYISRYDLLFIGAILIQVVLVWTKLESKDELKVISIFSHIIFCLIFVGF